MQLPQTVFKLSYETFRHPLYNISYLIDLHGKIVERKSNVVSNDIFFLKSFHRATLHVLPIYVIFM